MKIQPVIHVSLLEPASKDPYEEQVMPPPEPVEIEGHKQWEVEGVLNCHRRYRRP